MIFFQYLQLFFTSDLIAGRHEYWHQEKGRKKFSHTQQIETG